MVFREDLQPLEQDRGYVERSDGVNLFRQFRVLSGELFQLLIRRRSRHDVEVRDLGSPIRARADRGLERRFGIPTNLLQPRVDFDEGFIDIDMRVETHVDVGLRVVAIAEDVFHPRHGLQLFFLLVNDLAFNFLRTGRRAKPCERSAIASRPAV